MAKFTNKSIFTNLIRTMDFPQYTQEQFENRYNAWKIKGVMIQEAFPELSDNGREFIMTGATGDEWDHYMSPMEERDDVSRDRLNDWYE